MLDREPFPTFAKVTGAMDWSRYAVRAMGGWSSLTCAECGQLDLFSVLPLDRMNDLIRYHEAEHHSEGPWNGLEDLLPGEEGLPRSPKQILKLAQENGWGFGPISLVMRVNHPDKPIPPFFVGWRYAIDTGKWSFDSSRDMTGFALSVPAIRELLVLGGPGD